MQPMQLLICEKDSAVQSTGFEHLSGDMAFIVTLFRFAATCNVSMLMTGFSSALPIHSTLDTWVISTTHPHDIYRSRPPRHHSDTESSGRPCTFSL